MNERLPQVVAVLLVVVALAAVPVVGMAAQADGTNETDATETNDADETDDGNETDDAAVDPGAQFAGVVGVQEAEIAGDVDRRTFGIKVAQAASNDSKADVVAEQLGDVEERLASLEQRKTELEEARENGSMSEGEYRAKVARLHAETKTAEKLTNDTENASQGLPVELLESKGINATAIQTLKERASEMSGPEVAEIARSIAGPDVGESARPDHAGPPGNETEGERGPPDDAGSGDERGPPDDAQGDDGNESVEGDENETAGGGSDAGNGPNGGAEAADNGQSDDGYAV